MNSEDLTLPELFKGDFRDWQNNACIYPLAVDPTYAYIEGYKRAADLLVSHIKATSRDQDFLVYPIVYLYRHHLELSLKEIVRNGSTLLDDSALKAEQTHSLTKLWPIAKKVIQKVWPEEPDNSEYVKIDHFISEIAKFDDSSTTFRYPRTRQGANTVQGLQHINLRHFAECMQSICSLLDGASLGISFYLDEKESSVE
jgi:hypothetical protein